VGASGVNLQSAADSSVGFVARTGAGKRAAVPDDGSQTMVKPDHGRIRGRFARGDPIKLEFLRIANQEHRPALGIQLHLEP
jgi:hypothetical protein